MSADAGRSRTEAAGLTAEGLVLVTGAAGFIARCVLPRLSSRHRLRLLDRRPIPAWGEAERVTADITRLPDVADACAGVDTVVHLAAEPSMRAGFDELLGPNIVGAYNVFEAARQAGCRRVIFASSINTVLGYGSGISVHWEQPVNPVNLYGASKCYGEALARQFSHRGLPALCVRIGAVHRASDRPRPRGDEYEHGWISARDLARLFECCIATEDLDFAIVHAQGAHERPRLDMDHTRALLGFEPEDGTRPRHKPPPG